MRILPYRTLENVIEGAVVTFVEITKQKELQEQLQELARIARNAQDYAENMVDTIHEPLLVLNADLKVVSANSSFYEFFHARAGRGDRTIVVRSGQQPMEHSRAAHVAGRNPAAKDEFQGISSDTRLSSYRATHNDSERAPDPSEDRHGPVDPAGDRRMSLNRNVGLD